MQLIECGANCVKVGGVQPQIIAHGLHQCRRGQPRMSFVRSLIQLIADIGFNA